MRFPAAQMIGLAAALVLVVAGCQATGNAAPAGVPPLPPFDPGQVRHGRQVYLDNCATCHGQNAQGAPNWQQPDARGDLPAPPHEDSGHTWRHPDAQLVEIIKDGQRDRFNKTPELTMPAFKDQLSDAEMAAVIVYFKSLWSSEHRRYQEQQNQRPPVETPPGVLGAPTPAPAATPGAS